RVAAVTQTVGRTPPSADRLPQTAGRLRVGFVSPDLRRHSVSYFLAPLIEHLDRARFEVVCYATGGQADDVTEVFRRQTDRWIDSQRSSDGELEARIRADRVDALIDLSGHAPGGRLAVFAQRPAKIQIGFLGYPTTTGLMAMDFRISDALVDPSDATQRS